MFGVFTPYEQQLLYDWIAGDWQAPAPADRDPLAPLAEPATAGGDVDASRSRCGASCCGYPPSRAWHAFSN